MMLGECAHVARTERGKNQPMKTGWQRLYNMQRSHGSNLRALHVDGLACSYGNAQPLAAQKPKPDDVTCLCKRAQQSWRSPA